MIRDLLLAPRGYPDDKNYGPGYLDIIAQEGHLLEVSGNDVVPQAVLKATIAPLNTANGYGVAIKEFRGTKNIVPMRLAVITRLLRNVAIISKWYSTDIEITDFDIFTTPVESSFKIELRVNETLITASV